MKFNLSTWALKNPQLVLFIMLLVAVLGAYSYTRLGQSEDPPFTFRVMAIHTLWPGASAEEVARQVTDRIEKTLMETGAYERVVSYSRSGESQVTFFARDTLPGKAIPGLWYQVRKKVGDIRHTLPPEVQGPFFNDEFGTTFGNIYALTGADFDYALRKEYAQRLLLRLQRIPDVGKVELLGLQEEKIWVELASGRLASLGLSPLAVQQALQGQNAQVDSGFFETESERITLRVSGRIGSVQEIRDLPLRIGERSFRLGDIAEVRRGLNDPMAPRMRFMGEDAIGLAVSMKEGGDILQLGKTLDKEFKRLQNLLPLGMQLHKVSDQPQAVRSSVGEFVRTLAEALVIVLVVSFFSLGWRSGLVVALSIPLVLSITFAIMWYFDIGLHKISLGALVLALGLLVDDAIIAVEIMAIKMEQGLDRLRATSFAWSSTAFPMLTGTLITVAGFLPIATAQSSVAEYTRSLFQVVSIALLVSWVAAVIFVPWLGERLLPDYGTHKTPHKNPYDSPLYRRIRFVITACVKYRILVIGATLLAFVLSLFLFTLIPKQFFPPSTRLELVVDLKLAEGASLKQTEAEVQRLEALLKEHPDIESYVAYIGSGSPRFYLPLDQQLPAASFAQFVLLSKDLKTRETVRLWLIETLDVEFPSLRARVQRLENGPPVGYPIQFRVMGEHIDTVRVLARQVAEQIRANPYVSNVHLDWEEPSKRINLVIDQARARALGISSEALSSFIYGRLHGVPLGQFREGNELISILFRGNDIDRENLSLLPDLAVPTASGQSVPLSQIARLDYGFEEGIIWHHDRLPNVTVRADIYGEQQPASLVEQINPGLDVIRAQLPPGYALEIGGTEEASRIGQRSIMLGMPLFVLVTLTLLMMQLKRFSCIFLVFLTAPLGLIGVSLFLLLLNQPFGFIALLGSIALAGMIIRNSVILVDQTERYIAAGVDLQRAVIEAAVRRFRPIVLTALTAVLAMIPLARSPFFGPMAVAIMGGLIVATVLTLLFLPALYAAWFSRREVTQSQSTASTTAS